MLQQQTMQCFAIIGSDDSRLRELSLTTTNRRIQCHYTITIQNVTLKK